MCDTQLWRGDAKLCCFICSQGVNLLFHGRSLKYILTCNKDAIPEVIIPFGLGGWGSRALALCVVRSAPLTGRELVQGNFYQKIPKPPQSKVLLPQFMP